MTIGLITKERLLFGPNLLTQFVGKGVFRSVQAGTVTISNGNFTNTAVLSPIVVAANAILIPTGSTFNNASDTTSSGYLGTLQLTDGSTVTGVRISNAAQLTLSFVVLEFQPGVIRTNQSGIVLIAGASASNTGTLPIAVNTARAFPIFQGAKTDDTSGFGAGFDTTVTLTNATTVTMSRGGTAGNTTGAFQVVEFYL